MGLIRFLLAAAVVLGHSQGWGTFPNIYFADGFIRPYHAVQAFFILSGFYMSLTYPRYGGRVATFYLSRYSRLLPTYWIFASGSVALWFIFPQHELSKAYLTSLANADGWWGGLVFFVNVTMIGADSLIYFPQGPQWPQYWAIPQIWSIGTEIWFYLLVPLLVPSRTRTLIILIAAGTFLRFIFIAKGMPFHPWQQNVFACEMPFFLIGILSQRLYVWAEGQDYLSRPLGWCTAIAGCLFIAVGNKLHLYPLAGESLWNSLVVAIVLFVLIPPTFYLTKANKIDRFIGEFAYPIYLCHIAIVYYFLPARFLWQGYFLLLLCVLISLPVVLLVEHPIDKWRSRLRMP